MASEGREFLGKWVSFVILRVSQISQQNFRRGAPVCAPITRAVCAHNQGGHMGPPLRKMPIIHHSPPRSQAAPRPSFPSSAWERAKERSSRFSPDRSAALEIRHPLAKHSFAPYWVPKRSLGTRKNGGTGQPVQPPVKASDYPGPPWEKNRHKLPNHWRTPANMIRICP
jgi:hypothetical protein